jgi:hypothetical protein
LRRLLGDDRGNALMEAVAVFPVLVIVGLGAMDLSRFVVIHQRLDRAAYTLADLATRDSTVTEGLLTQIFDSVEQVAQPYDLGTDGIAILAGLEGQSGGAVRIIWQRTGAGAGGAGSELGNEGDTANLPAGFSLGEGEGAVVAEIFYDFEPLWIPEMIVPREFYFRSFFRPRRSQSVQLVEE